MPRLLKGRGLTENRLQLGQVELVFIDEESGEEVSGGRPRHCWNTSERSLTERPCPSPTRKTKSLPLLAFDLANAGQTGGRLKGGLDLLRRGGMLPTTLKD